MLFQRSLYPHVENHLPDKRHTIITGARQVGKTSLLRLIHQKLKAEGHLVFQLSLEDGKVLSDINTHPDNVFLHIPALPTPAQNGQAEKRLYLLIDEVQYAADPTRFLKFLYDKYEGNLKVVATGSSAFYIDRKFTDSLAGRKRVFQLYTLSYEEYLVFIGRNDLAEEVNMMRERPEYISSHSTALKAVFYQYLIFGGYPAVATEPDLLEKKLLLDELKNAYVKRDIAESGVSMEAKFFLLFQLLADQTGNLVNRHELSKTVQVDFKTIENYLYVLEKCCHIHLMKPFFRNIQKELTKMPKVYFNDLGLRNALLNRLDPIENRSDKGALLENYFYCRLRQQYETDQLKFWRTADQHEIDFVAETSFGQGRAYEVKWNKRNFSAEKLKKFTAAYPAFALECLDETDFVSLL
ncbi:MAG TPA: ATP-binding protein [Saprospiraceae bacterium]|nr:ATP-binding protein [Saprospiraceae bacterium]HRK83738.1 ATP-binding protein [Saprospiraceae bacterium]